MGEIPIELDGANLTENADRLTNISIQKTYLLHILKSEIIQRLVDKEKTITAQPKLALTRIRKFVIPVPSIREQKAIAAILQTADEQIELNKRKLAALKVQKKGLMQQLLTGKLRVG